MKNLSVRFGEAQEYWDQFVKRSPQGSVLLLSSFLRSLSIPFELVTFYEGSEIVAGVPIFIGSDGKPKAEPVRCFLGSGIDCLVMNEFVVEKIQ